MFRTSDPLLQAFSRPLTSISSTLAASRSSVVDLLIAKSKGHLVLVSVQEMKRVLFIFAKLNPGLRYVQGMNELLAPLYYQFRNDTDEGAPAHAEADAFYCFMDIIAEFRDHFCQQLVGS